MDLTVRVLFAPIPTAGHFYPLVPLARALAAAGHDVAIATAGEYAPEVEKAGLTLLPCGPDESTVSHAFAPAAVEAEHLPIADRRPFMFAKRFAEITAPMAIDELVDVCKSWTPDLVVYDTASLAAPLAAAVVGARSAQHSWGPLFPAPVVANAARAIAPLWSKWGVEPDSTAGLFRDMYVDIAPPALQFDEITTVSRRVAMRPEGYDGTTGSADSTDSAALPSGRPLVYATLGTMGLFNRSERVRLIMDGLSDLDANVVFTIGRNNDPSAFGELPGNVVVHQYLPQSAVLPHADAVVTHGGAGSMLGALRYACPALTLPAGADQFDNAKQLAASGAGIFLAPPEVTAEAVRTAVQSLLDEPSYGQAAVALAAEIAAMPDAATAAAELIAAIV